MRKEKVCLGLFNVLVEKKNQQMLLFLLPHHGQALLAQRSVLTSVSSGSWSGVTFDIFAVSGSGGQDASWRRIGSEQCSHPCPTKKAVVHLRSLQHESPAAWPGAWQGLITAWNQSTGPSSGHLHFPTLASGMWGRNTAWDVGTDVPGVLAVRVCVWIYVYDRCLGAWCLSGCVCLCVEASLI